MWCSSATVCMLLHDEAGRDERPAREQVPVSTHKRCSRPLRREHRLDSGYPERAPVRPGVTCALRRDSTLYNVGWHSRRADSQRLPRRCTASKGSYQP